MNSTLFLCISLFWLQSTDIHSGRQKELGEGGDNDWF